MRARTLLVIAFAVVLPAQSPLHPRPGDPESSEDVRLPNGKMQRDEILKAEYQKSVEDARELAKLADELKLALEKNDRNVLSIPLLKKTEEIEKLARKIRDRMKH